MKCAITPDVTLGLVGNDCWGGYIAAEVSEGRTTISCMDSDCGVSVGADMIQLLAPAHVAGKLSRFAVGGFVDEHPQVSDSIPGIA